MAALTTFGKSGCSNASIGEIAREADVTKGALYWHFLDKQDFYGAVIDMVLKRKIGAISKSLDGLSSTKDKVEAVVRATMDFYRSDQLVFNYSYSGLWIQRLWILIGSGKA